MTESDMGDLQDALSNIIPQSCIPTFDAMESWSAVDETQVRAWIGRNASGPTPDVFIPIVNAYYAPRPSVTVQDHEAAETRRILAGKGDRHDLDAMDWRAKP